MSNLDRGIEIVQKVIEEDAKPTNNTRTPLTIFEYLARAETLKEHLAVSYGARGGTKKAGPELEKLRGALSQSILSEKPSVKWDDVAGLEEAKASLKEGIILPITSPHLFTGKRTPWKGVLLYGPPGTGKSYLAKAVAAEAKSTLFSAPILRSLFYNLKFFLYRLVKQLFELAHESKPSIIFIDEIDFLAGSRSEAELEGSRRIKTEFLVQMNRVGHDDTGVFVLGATNVPWQLDNAIKQRFEKRIYIPLPGPEARRHMFELEVGETPCEMAPKDYRMLADQADGYSGSDISSVVRDALMQPVRKVIAATHFKHVDDGKKWTPCSPADPGAVEKSWTEIDPDKLLEPPLKSGDFLKSLATARSTVTESDVKPHDEWTNESGAFPRYIPPPQMPFHIEFPDIMRETFAREVAKARNEQRTAAENAAAAARRQIAALEKKIATLEAEMTRRTSNPLDDTTTDVDADAAKPDANSDAAKPDVDADATKPDANADAAKPDANGSTSDTTPIKAPTKSIFKRFKR
ncbi:P-loop containing nucleoside triphosphate hydrolase protein [Mycena capillaripes]|nr:P-loop containing nucleoside triphosphate hydrolase protein [Mycena capillaripes]